MAVVVDQWEDLVAAIVATTPLSRHDAEDVLQDFTVDLLVGGISAEPESWLAYIKRALRNRALNKHRDEARAERRVQDGPPPDWLLPNKNHLNEGVAAREVFLEALTDLRQLPETEREVFLLRYWDDLKPIEIAARTGFTTKQVDKRLQQAKERLATMRAARRESGAYALLALVLQPVTRHESSTVLASPLSGSVMSLAAAVAFSLVTALTGGVPATVDPAIADAPHAKVVVSSGPGVRKHAGSDRSWSARDVVGASRADHADPARAPLGPVTPTLGVSPSCIEHVCVGTGAYPPMPGDTITVTAANREYGITEDVTPVCEYLPGNPAVHCSRQEPERWVVKEVPPPPDGGALS